jgi:small subunit ribosomal protein S1
MTTSNTIDSPITELSEDDFKAFFDGHLENDGITAQSVVTGRVVSINDTWVTVDINYKAEGLVPVGEFRNEEGELTIAAEDTVEVYLGGLESADGMLRLSKKKADMMKAWDDIAEAVEADKNVTGVVIQRVKGGLQVDIGVRAFLPGSQVDLRPVKNLDKFIGETYEFKIIKFNKKRGNIVLSRRVLLEEDRASKRTEIIDKITEGAILPGIVKNITDYGAFVDLGGIDGLLHITDMSYGRLNHPSEKFEIGAAVEVKVLRFDRENQRVSLGYKQISPDPWAEAEYKYPIGAIVRGKVVSIPEYGAFIELEDGIEGLVHISEMTWNKRVKTPAKLVEIGQTIEAKVLGMDIQSKRISLGIKQLESNPWDVVENQYPVGSIVKGQVRNITDFGIFIGIEDGIDGLVHISDLSWSQRVRHPSEVYNKGDEVEARVLSIDKEAERFSLGVKQLSDDPWNSIHNRFFLGTVIEGTVVHLADFGVFVEIEAGVEGLIHVTELADASGDWAENYPAGKKVQAEVIHIGAQDRKISLSESSVGEAGEASERAPAAAVRPTDSSSSLGDVMGDLGRRLRGASSEE